MLAPVQMLHSSLALALGCGPNRGASLARLRKPGGRRGSANLCPLTPSVLMAQFVNAGTDAREVEPSGIGTYE